MNRSILTLGYILLFIYFNAPLPAKEWLITIPAFMIIYFLIFNMGKPEIMDEVDHAKLLSGNQVLIFPFVIPISSADPEDPNNVYTIPAGYLKCDGYV